MRSFPVRSWRKSLHTSLDEIFGSPVEFVTRNTHCDPLCGSDDVEIVPVTFVVPHKKRHYLLTSETCSGGGSEPLLSSDACIVCEVSDKRVSRCRGSDCLLSFHVECLNASSVDDLANPYYCPYCWLILQTHILALREKAIVTLFRDEVKDNVPKSLEDTTFHGDGNGNQEHSPDFVSDQELQGEEEEDACSCKGEQVQVGNDSDISRGESMPLVEETANLEVGTDNFQDAEDDETAQDQNTAGAGQKGDGSGKENDQVQQNEKRIRRRQIVFKAIDSEISSSESTNEQTGEDVTEQITKVAKSKTLRDISFFNKDQRRRILWTSKEEETLKVGVEKFAAEANKNMPWRKILEMGKKVFHETRTLANLKDKWRNMIRANNEQDSNTNHSNGS